MDTKKVKDLMVPLEEYAVVSNKATLVEALHALEKAQQTLKPGQHRHRAVLVLDKDNRVIGKIGHLGFLKALEPKYNVLGDMGKLSQVGLNAEFINSMMDNFHFFQDELCDLCKRARHINVVDVMHPVTESIDENASLSEAIHNMVMWSTLSVLVTRGKDIVGLLRLSDVFQEVADFMKKECDYEKSS